MLKRVTTTLIVALMVGGTAFADAKLGGVARQLSLGGGGARGVAINPFVWDDPTNMYSNPAWGGMYRDYAWMNIGGGPVLGTTTGVDGYTFQHGGMNVSLGDGWSVGTIFAQDPSAANTVLGFVAPGGFGVLTGVNGLSVSGPVEVLRFMTSYGSGNTTFGVGILYGWMTADATTSGSATAGANGTDELSTTVFGANAGIYHDLGSGSAIEGTVAFISSTGEDKLGRSTAPATADASLTEIALAIRAKLRVNNKVNFIPAASFGTASGDGTVPAGTAGNNVTDISATAFGAGAGLDLTVGDFYMAGGASYVMATGELTTTAAGATSSTVAKSTTSIFPLLQVGGEWSITDCLAARAGYIRAFGNSKSETTTAPVTLETNSFFGSSAVAVGGYAQNNLVVLGLAAWIGNFGIEATVSESALRRGFGLLGSGDNINSFGYMTMNYNWE